MRLVICKLRPEQAGIRYIANGGVAKEPATDTVYIWLVEGGNTRGHER